MTTLGGASFVCDLMVRRGYARGSRRAYQRQFMSSVTGID